MHLSKRSPFSMEDGGITVTFWCLFGITQGCGSWTK